MLRYVVVNTSFKHTHSIRMKGNARKLLVNRKEVMPSESAFIFVILSMM